MLAGPADDFTGRMFRALNSMMLDMLAAIARKHYDDRRRRQAQGVAKAKAEGKYRGRPEDIGRNAGIASLLAGVEVAVGRRPGSIGSPAEVRSPARSRHSYGVRARAGCRSTCSGCRQLNPQLIESWARSGSPPSRNTYRH
jgi:hypothetical protein